MHQLILSDSIHVSAAHVAVSHTSNCTPIWWHFLQFHGEYHDNSEKCEAYGPCCD